jgi:glutathione S-transferase
MKHFEVPFEEQVIELDRPDSSARIRAVSPSGRVPVLLDGANVVWESLAICEYVAEKYPDRKMWPWHSGDRALARSISNEMHAGFAPLRQNLPHQVNDRFPGFRAPEAAQRDIERIRKIWNDALERSGGPFLFKEFSIADAMYAPVANRFRTYDVKLDGRAGEYVQTMLAHPAMKIWEADAKRTN